MRKKKNQDMLRTGPYDEFDHSGVKSVSVEFKVINK